MSEDIHDESNDGNIGNAGEVKPQECGIVMPISATATHDAQHWGDVQELLHRGARLAGLEPKNVWAGSATDRITPRILSNLFVVPIAICDISDLNPNVMLELGMRLTSKKPTVVVAEHGSKVPFDIHDFGAIFYPSDLNILQMEKFFNELKDELDEKLNAFNEGTYKAFLSEVAIETIEPREKTVPFEQLVERRLDAIVSRIEELGSHAALSVPSTTRRKTNETKEGKLVITPRDDSRDIAEVMEIIRKGAAYLGSTVGGSCIIPLGSEKGAEDAIQYVRKALDNAGVIADIAVS